MHVVQYIPMYFLTVLLDSFFKKTIMYICRINKVLSLVQDVRVHV